MNNSHCWGLLIPGITEFQNNHAQPAQRLLVFEGIFLTTCHCRDKLTGHTPEAECLL